MKKIYWIAALLVLTFLGDRIGGIILSKAISKSQFRYSRLYNGQAESDILLLGNSRGLIFYQPYLEELTGKSTFNISYNGMPIDLAQVFVEDYYARYDAPTVMIIDVTICDRLNKQLIAGFNSYAPYSSNLESFIFANSPTMGCGAHFSHLFRYNNEIFQRAMFYLKSSDEDWLTDRIMNQNLIEKAINEVPYTINYSPDSTDYLLQTLNSIIKTAQTKGTTVSLVINPYYPPFAKKMVNLETFKKDIEKETGLKIHDYSTFVKDPNAFSDYQHLNKYGAKIYLDQLIKDGIIQAAN